MVGPAEAQRVQVGDRPRAHGEDVAQDAADAGRRALIGLDVARVVVALHLEDRRLAVADVDHAGILARAADHPGRLGRQLLQVDARAFVGAMLGPHDREDAELDQVGLAAQRVEDALIFLGREAVLGDDFGGDAGIRSCARPLAATDATASRRPSCELHRHDRGGYSPSGADQRRRATMSVKPIPEGYHSVTPYLIVDDAAEAIDFYKKAFGATEVLRMPMGDRIGHAEIKIGDRTSCSPTNSPSMGHLGPKARGGTTVEPDDLSRRRRHGLPARARCRRQGRSAAWIEGPVLGRPDGHADRSVRP